MRSRPPKSGLWPICPTWICPPGSRTVPVKVYLDGSSEVGVVGEYNISISVSDRRNQVKVWFKQQR